MQLDTKTNSLEAKLKLLARGEGAKSYLAGSTTKRLDGVATNPAHAKTKP